MKPRATPARVFGLRMPSPTEPELRKAGAEQADAFERYADAIARGRWPGGSVNRNGKREPDAERLLARAMIAAALRAQAKRLREIEPCRPRGNPMWGSGHDFGALALIVYGERQRRPRESVQRSIERVLDRLGMTDQGPDVSTVAKHYRALRPGIAAFLGGAIQRE